MPPPPITLCGAAQFEQEQLARLEGTEVCRRGRPEIDLAEVRMPPQFLEPVSVGDSDDEIDAHLQILRKFFEGKLYYVLPPGDEPRQQPFPILVVEEDEPFLGNRHQCSTRLPFLVGILELQERRAN